MKLSKALLAALVATICAASLSAQVTYTSTSMLNQGMNPGGLNTESDSTSTGWNVEVLGPQSANIWSPPINIPFPFFFYGVPYTQCRASQNGLVTFDMTSVALPSVNDNLPSANLPDNTICCFWDEFTASPPTGSGDNIITQTFGTAPNRQFWIKWFSFEYGNPLQSFAYFGCVFEETTNKVYLAELCYYSSTTANSFTVGIQQNATTATQIGTNTLNWSQTSNLAITNNGWYEFTPSGSIDGQILGLNSTNAALITTPYTDKVMLDFTAMTFGTTNRDVSSIKITKTGTMPDAAISAVKLFLDVNNNGVVDIGTDTQLGSGPLASGAITFALTPALTVPTGTPQRLLVAFTSVGALTVGDSLGFEIAASTDFVWSGGTDYTGYPLGEPPVTVTPPVISVGGTVSASVAPFNSSYYRKMNILPSTDLAAIPAGAAISEIHFYGTTLITDPVTFTNFELRLAHTTIDPSSSANWSNTWDANYSGAQTAVIAAERFTPEVIGAASPYKYVFKFDTPFIYNGTDGINYDMEWLSRENPGWTCQYDSVRSGLYATTPNQVTGTLSTAYANLAADIYFDPAASANLAWIADQHARVNVFDNDSVTDKVVLSMSAQTFGTAQNLTSLTFNKTGSVPNAAITDVRLVRDINGDGKVDAGDTVLGIGAVPSGTVTFSSLALSVTPGTPVPLLLAFSTTAALTATDTIGFELTSAASATWGGGQDVTAYPVAASATVTAPLVRIGAPFGTTSNAIPFAQTTYRHLTVYSADELRDIPAGALISEFRVFGNAATTLTFTNLEVRLAHSIINPYGGMSGTFDANWTGTQTAVISSASFTPVAVGTFGANTLWSFQFTSPFIYNGTDGLAVDFAWSGATGTGFSIQYSAGRQRVYSATYTATSGTLSASTGSFGVEFGFVLPTGVALLNQSPAGGVFNSPQTDMVVWAADGLSFGATQNLNSITFNQTGTIADAAFTAVKLVRDNNADGAVDAGDTTLASGTLTAGAITFTGTPLQAVTGAGVRLLLAVSLSGPLGNGTTMQFQVPATPTWSPGPDIGSYPMAGGLSTTPVTYTIAQSGTPDFPDIGAAFDFLETTGVTAPTILLILDSATYTATTSYTLGINASNVAVPVAGVSATNTITLRPAPGQKPKIQGNATGANLQTPLTGRGCLGIMTSFVTVEGIECFGGPNFGIMIQGNNVGLNPINNVIRRCIVHDIPDGPGIAFMGQNSAYADNIVIENNFVWNCLTNSIPTTSQILTLTYGSITWRNAANGSGTVRHNTVLHTSPFPTTGGIYAYSSSSTYPLHDLNNNIVICTDPTVPAIFLSSATSAPNAANCNFNFWFAQTHCNQTTSTPPLGTFAQWQASGRDANGSNLNPMLVSTTGTIDLHLAAGSPCIDPTGQTSTVAVDVDGDPRPAGLADIGADERTILEVLQGTTSIQTGGTIDLGIFGTVATPVTFTIKNNDPTNAVSLTPPVAITLGANLDAGTSVTTQPPASVPANSSVTFVVSIDPTAVGAFDFTLSITNNAPGQNPYTFTVTGIASPKIEIMPQGSTTVIQSGTTYIDTSVYAVQPLTHTFVISNLNGGTSLSITGTSASGVSGIASGPTANPPASSTVNPGNTTTFTVQFTPVGGAFEYSVIVNSNDVTTGTYTFNVQGTANTPPAFNVRIGGPSGTVISNAGSVPVPYFTTVASHNFYINVTDVDAGNTITLNTTISPAIGGQALAEWSESTPAAPITKTPLSGTFDVPLTNHVVTLTATDNLGGVTVFSFTIQVGANTDATMDLPTGSTFTGTVSTGFTTSIGPATLPATFTLRLFDTDDNDISVTAVSVVPAAPSGITAPGVTSNNPSGTVISFSGDAGLAMPGTYIWTLTITDGVGSPVNVDVSITVLNVAATHAPGPDIDPAPAPVGDGTAANPYTRTIGLATSQSFTLATVSDANQPQTLTQVAVLDDPANPSLNFSASFSGTGSSGQIIMSPANLRTVADVGDHTFTVQISDGVATIDVVVRVVVDTSQNSSPGAAVATGSSIGGNAAAGFTLSVGPGETLTNAILDLTDPDADTTVVTEVTGGGQIAGITAPPTGAQTQLSWTGTCDADNAPGDYVYTVTFTDGVTTPVTIELTLTVENVAPTHLVGASATGSGSTADPYTATHEVGKGGPKAMAVVGDVNTGQTLSIATVTPGAGNPTGGSGFLIALTNGVVNAIPAAVLKNRDVGVHRFTVGITDGVTTTTFELSIKVIAPKTSDPASDGCVASGSTGNLPAILLAGLIAAPLLLRRRRTA